MRCKAQWRSGNAVVCKTTMHRSDSGLGLQIDFRLFFGYYYLMPASSYHSRRYTLNEGFFSCWTSEMAYVLGFWFADGYMRKDRSYRISFSSVDTQVLETINGLLSSDAPIEPYVRKGILEKAHRLTVRSKQLYADLMKIGGQCRKSRVLKFPIIPDDFVRDFIRGYFDGDGSVHYITYRASKNGKFYTEMRSNFTSGSRKFLESIRSFLILELGLSFRTIGQYGPFQYKLGFGQKDTHKLLNYMYYPGHIGSLQRKAKFREVAAI